MCAVGVFRQSDAVLVWTNFNVDVKTLVLWLVDNGLAGIEHAVVVHLIQQICRLRLALRSLSVTPLLPQRLRFIWLEGLSNVFRSILLGLGFHRRLAVFSADYWRSSAQKVDIMRLWHESECLRVFLKLDFVDVFVFNFPLVACLLLPFLVELLELVYLDGGSLVLGFSIQNCWSKGQTFGLRKGFFFCLSSLSAFLLVFFASLHQVIGVVLLSGNFSGCKLPRFFV